MGTTATRLNITTDLLANQLLERLSGTAAGHCARVDYLMRDEAMAICKHLRARSDASKIAFYVLSPRRVDVTDLFISADEAIELRNRKQAVMCLFIPADVVDAAFSSLANSFELIDGRELYYGVLSRLVERLPQEAKRIVQAVFAQVRAGRRVDVVQRVAFAAAVAERAAADELEAAGKELWRLGLIVDAAPDFTERLRKNRDCARELSSPRKLQATPSERVQGMGVDRATTGRLLEFFRGRSMNDVSAWSRAVLDRPELTFDTWIFPEEEHSDLRSIEMAPFTDKDGKVERYCKLFQPDGQAGALQAQYGPMGTLVVKWKTEPAQPSNLHSWRVEIVPAGGSREDVDVDLPAREVRGSQRNVTLKLDMEPDTEEPIDYPVRVRVTPLDAGKNEIRKQQTDEALFTESEDFYLVEQTGQTIGGPRQELRRTVPTIAFGRIEYLISSAEAAIAEERPQWAAKDGKYFSLKLSKHQEVHIAVSPVLMELERSIIGEPRSGGCCVVRVDDLTLITMGQVVICHCTASVRERCGSPSGAPARTSSGDSRRRIRVT